MSEHGERKIIQKILDKIKNLEEDVDALQKHILEIVRNGKE